MKRMLSLFTAAAMVLSLAACGKQETVETEPAKIETKTTYAGTVSAVSTDSLTVSTEDGEVTVTLTDTTTFQREIGGMGEMSGEMGQLPEGGTPGEMGDVPDGEMPMDKPEGNGGQGEPMEKPDGEMGQQGDPMDKPDEEMGNQPNGTPPEMPNGQQPGEGDAPEKPDGMNDMGMNMPGITVADISVGDTVTVETDGNGNALSVILSGGEMGMGGPGGMSSGVDSYDAVTEFTADATEDGANYTSTGKDENTIHVSGGADVTLSNATITRDSADSTGGDNASFYGVGAAALVTDGSLTIDGGTITTDAAGGAGVFAYGDGTAYVSNTAIDTAQDTSGGIHVAGGGTLYAWDLAVETDGESSAAIRSDRGSGTMVVDGGSYTSNGVGSPAIYSAADITVNNANLTSTGSEAICIEGLNTIRLFGCDLSGDMEDLTQNDCTWNVILYQSMSGDSEIGNSTFEMVGGSLTSGNGGMFYTTNTESTFILSNVDIIYSDNSEFFLKCTGNANQRGWGKSGDNGADCHFTARNQAMAGNVIWDSISKLDFFAMEGSSLNGTILQDETHAGNGGNGYCNVYIDADSNWTVTGDSRVSNLFCEGTILDADGNTVSIVGTDGTVYVEGNSQYTITVDSYSNTADFSGVSTLDCWDDYSVEKI